MASALPDGDVSAAEFKDLSGAVKKWREVGPLDYREVGGQTHLKFVTDEKGNILYLASDDFIPVELIQRVYGLEQLDLLKYFGLSTIAVCFLTVVIWFGGWIVRRRFSHSLEMTPRQYWLRLASRLSAVLYLLIIGGWFGLITAVSADETLLLGGRINGWIGTLYVLGAIGILGGLVMIANGALRLLNGPGGWMVRLGDIVLALGGVYGIWVIFNYGLANFQFNI